jgi:hypothetical protein
MVFVLLMACYLLVNDDLLALFLSFNNSIINDYFVFFTKFVVCFTSAMYFLFIADSLKYQRITFRIFTGSYVCCIRSYVIM